MSPRAAAWSAIVAISLALVALPLLWAADSALGTWVQQGPASAGAPLTMTVEAWGKGGRKLTYRVKLPNGADAVLTVQSPMDGTEAPVLVNGKPSGETMAIKRLDSHHTVAVLRFNGQQFGVSRGTLSPDLKTLTVENEITATAGGRQPGKATDIWVRK